MSKILVFGEILWDIVGNEKSLAGAPFNFAVHSVRCGAECGIISGIGRDELGEAVLAKTAEYSINNDFLQINENHPTGMTLITFSNGEPQYDLKSNTAYDNIEYSENLQKKIDFFGADCFYFGTVGQRSAVSRETLKNILKNSSFSNVFCDINLRDGNYTKETVEFSLKNCSILKINRQEIAEIFKMGFVKYNGNIKDFGVAVTEKFSNIKLVIITLDRDGAYVYDKERNEELTVSAKDVEVKSPTGAGDSFCAGFITDYLKGNSLEKAITKATEIAGYVLQFTEAIPEERSKVYDL